MCQIKESNSDKLKKENLRWNCKCITLTKLFACVQCTYPYCVKYIKFDKVKSEIEFLLLIVRSAVYYLKSFNSFEIDL